MPYFSLTRAHLPNRSSKIHRLERHACEHPLLSSWKLSISYFNLNAPPTSNSIISKVHVFRIKITEYYRSCERQIISHRVSSLIFIVLRFPLFHFFFFFWCPLFIPYYCVTRTNNTRYTTTAFGPVISNQKRYETRYIFAFFVLFFVFF